MHRSQILKAESFFSTVKIRVILLLALMLSGSMFFAHAQNVSPYFGLGNARDSVGTTNTSTIACPTGQLFDGLICEPGTKMGGLFGMFGVDFMFKKHLGVNAEYVFHLKRSPFLADDSLNMRPSFYDINALWQPLTGKRVIPVLEGGVGMARISLYQTQTAPITGVTDLSSFPAGAHRSHFQLHFAAGLKFYVRGNLFVKPQFDFRYVTHLTDQFGRNIVPEFSGSVGYTFGAH
jgi:hypothetical protein